MEKQKLSTIKMNQSLRNGHHATVFEVQRDPSLKNKDIIRENTKEKAFPFIGGSHYKGSWSNDKKEGFGIQINPNNTKYEGEWLANFYHGRGTLWIKKKKTYHRQYVGDWVKGNMEGQGVYYYEDHSIYKGGWIHNKKSGSGRYEYNNGNVYNGEWMNDQQDGFGTLHYADGNVYEGLWVKGNKEGPGLFYYASTKKIYQGEWYDNQPRCGEFRIPLVEEELRFSKPLPKGIFANEFDLPNLTLANPDSIIDIAISDVRLKSLQRNQSYTNDKDIQQQMQSSFEDNEIINNQFYSIIKSESIEQANKVFHSLCNNPTNNLISIFDIGEVLSELGLNLTVLDINDIIQQLQLKDTYDITFSETIEIASYIHQKNNNL